MQIHRCLRHCLLGVATIVIASTSSWAQTPTVTPSIGVQFTTNRGCLETGQSPSFAVGEGVTLILRVNSSVQTQATATLFDVPPSGPISVISLGQIPTNQTFAFAAGIAPPTGIEQVIFQAKIGSQTRQRSCSFIVTGGTPGVTPSRTANATRSATLTRTPRPSSTPTRTPLNPLDVSIRTDRGCLETGDDPVFHVGEKAIVMFRVNGPSNYTVFGVIKDYLPNGWVQQFSLGFFPTNQQFAFRAVVAPPTGVERLELRARSGGRTGTASCSFTVEGPLPTRTRTGTRTKTPTRTRSMTATATPTATPTVP